MLILAVWAGLASGNFAYQAAMSAPDYAHAALITWHQTCALGALALTRLLLRRAS